MLRVFKFEESTQVCHAVFETETPLQGTTSHVRICGNYVLQYDLIQGSSELCISDLTAKKRLVVTFNNQYVRTFFTPKYHPVSLLIFSLYQDHTFWIESAVLVEDVIVVIGDEGEVPENNSLRVFAVQAQVLFTKANSDFNVRESGRLSERVTKMQSLPGMTWGWTLAINAFRPFWKKRANTPIELFIAGLGSPDNPVVQSYRFQIPHTTLTDWQPSSSNVPGSGFLPLHLKEASSSCAPCSNPHHPFADGLSNAGLFFNYLNPNISYFVAFCDKEQPSLVATETAKTLMEATDHDGYWGKEMTEPWSNAMFVGSKDTVWILRLD